MSKSAPWRLGQVAAIMLALNPNLAADFLSKFDRGQPKQSDPEAMSAADAKRARKAAKRAKEFK